MKVTLRVALTKSSEYVEQKIEKYIQLISKLLKEFSDNINLNQIGLLYNTIEVNENYNIHNFTIEDKYWENGIFSTFARYYRIPFRNKRAYLTKFNSNNGEAFYILIPND